EVDAMRLHQARRADDDVEDQPAGIVQGVELVDLAGTIQLETHQEIVLPEELAPFAGEFGAVGLNGVLDVHPGAAVFLNTINGESEVVETAQGGFALPGQGDLWPRLRLEQFPEMRFE